MELGLGAPHRCERMLVTGEFIEAGFLQDMFSQVTVSKDLDLIMTAKHLYPL
jgi:hypothetical protein